MASEIQGGVLPSSLSRIALTSLLVTVSLERPYEAHRHQHRHQHYEKHAIIWTTQWDILTKTIDITTTIWVGGNVVFGS